LSTVNGKPYEFPPGTSVADLLACLGIPTRGVAVAVNAEVVRRADWKTTRLRPGDRVEVLTPAQGG
jgi:sulfur carrier protein